MNVRGFAELEKELELLEDKVQRRIIQKALRKASKNFAEAVARTAPQSTYDKDNLVLSESIIATSKAPDKETRLSNAEHTATMYVGPEKKIYYAGWVERGTSKSPPHPFLEPALYREQDNIIDDIQTEIYNELTKRKGKWRTYDNT